MRTRRGWVAWILALSALLVPLAAHAANGPCPDDPVASKNCNAEAPPYYVVINRAADLPYPERPGTGCQPIILNHPECTECDQPECDAIDIQAEVCADLPAESGDILFVMCCNCPATDPDGAWLYREYELDGLGGCKMVEDWSEGLPPGTGIDLPAPLIIGGLAALGVVCLGAGLLIRRLTVHSLVPTR